MKARDLEYIENRLGVPCLGASEAHERLRRYTTDHERAELANRLMYAMQEFTTTCRSIRTRLYELEVRDRD